MSEQISQANGSRDFDFLIGRWRVRHRRLRRRLADCRAWDEFAGVSVERLLPAGLGNWEENSFDHEGSVTGLAFRFFHPGERRWSISWIDSRRRALDPPLFGSFDGQIGLFRGEETHEGRRILVRFLWSRADPSAPRWEQAFSADGGTAWETNWIMDFSRRTALNRGEA
jgi:hypothetical protein